MTSPFDKHRDALEQGAAEVEIVALEVVEIAVGDGADFVRRRHGLNPGYICSAGLKAFHLLGKGRDGFVISHCAERDQQSARRADRAGNDHLAARLFRQCIDDDRLIFQLEPK